MTRAEAEVCMRFSLPVYVVSAEDIDYPAGYQGSREPPKYYKIMEAHKFYNKEFHRWDYSFATSPENAQRSWKTEPADNLLIDESKRDFIESEIRKAEKQYIKRVIENLLVAGENKTSLVKMFRNLIDEVKEQMNGKR